MTEDDLRFYHDRVSVRHLVLDAIDTHNEEIIISLLIKLLEEYIEIARLTTDNKYRKTWTHKDVLNYITYGEPT